MQIVYLHKYKKYDTIPIRHLLTLSDDTGGGRMANTEDIDRAAKEQGYKSRNEFVIAAINEKRGV